MKKLIALFVICFGFSLSAVAQHEAHAPAGHPEVGGHDNIPKRGPAHVETPHAPEENRHFDDRTSPVASVAATSGISEEEARAASGSAVSTSPSLPTMWATVMAGFGIRTTSSSTTTPTTSAGIWPTTSVSVPTST